MDNFCKLTPKARKPYFETAAINSGFPILIIEKDFWVCWTLKRLFTLPEIGEHLIFKGGTSLSKVFNVIERFSEDIDISIDKKHLGFIDAKDPEQAESSKHQQQLIEQLAVACRTFVQTRMLENLRNQMAAILGTTDGWRLEIDETDSDGQTLLFLYPNNDSIEGYIRPAVKIEMGARSDQWPAHIHNVRPYISDQVPDVMEDPFANPKTLDVARTFWEKATILHMYAHWPEGKSVTPGQSRHYYDFFCLIKSKFKNEAIQKINLLNRVSNHKRIYFRAAWAKYDEAVPGTLKLIPTERVLNEMKRDYAQMKEMFFAEPASWSEIITAIQKFEREV